MTTHKPGCSRHVVPGSPEADDLPTPDNVNDALGDADEDVETDDDGGALAD